MLSSHVEWAIHCCLALTGLGEDERVATKQLAEFHGVPKEYLSKALQALASAEIIGGSLGPKGGYRLAKAPADITVLDIVDAIEGGAGHFQCTEIRRNNPCLKQAGVKVTGVCAIASVMRRADQAWRKELQSVTLADLSKSLRTTVGPQLLQLGADWLRKRA